MIKFIAASWQSVVFAVVGLTCLYFSFVHLKAGDVTGASAIFAMAFLGFLYSNLSRFKRFKGLGFEAELWEDKQKEAADLIERLKDVVSVYTTEVVMGAVRRGRWSDGKLWDEAWALFNDLVGKHNALGQRIDFSLLKREMDDYFLFDIFDNNRGGIERALFAACQEAGNVIRHEFGMPITDAAGYAKRHQQLENIAFTIQNPFTLRSTHNLAQDLLSLAELSQAKLKAEFGLEVNLPEPAIERMRAIAELYRSRPINVTSEFIGWAQPS